MAVGTHCSGYCHCGEVAICREAKIRVNVSTVHRDRKSGHCREVAVGGGSTVCSRYVYRWSVYTFRLSNYTVQII